jgi:hypothetical protein
MQNNLIKTETEREKGDIPKGGQRIYLSVCGNNYKIKLWVLPSFICYKLLLYFVLKIKSLNTY